MEGVKCDVVGVGVQMAVEVEQGAAAQKEAEGTPVRKNLLLDNQTRRVRNINMHVAKFYEENEYLTAL